MASHHQHQSTAGAFSAFSLSFASPFRLCANSQNSMTFKLPCFYGFLNSAFNLKSRRQRHITPINLYLLNSDSMKKLLHNNFTTSQFKRSSHSTGFHLQVSTSIGEFTNTPFLCGHFSGFNFHPPLVSS